MLGLLSLQRLSPDAPAADDADMLPAAAAATGADDAFPDFINLAAKLQLTPEERAFIGKQHESKTPDLAAVEPLLARNAETMALFVGFARKTRFTDPEYQDRAKVSFQTPVRQYFPLVSAAHLSSLRAALLLQQGRAPEALEEALTIADAGQVLLRSGQPLISTLVGFLLEGIGARRALDVMEKGKLEKKSLLDAARRLSSHRGGAAALQESLRFEHLCTTYMLGHLKEYATKGPEGRWYNAALAQSRFLYQPKRTRALFAGRLRPVVLEAAKPCLQARVPEFVPAPLGAGPNFLGRSMFNIAIPQYDKLFFLRCQADYRVSAAAASAAIAAFRLDRKRPPAALDGLVPGYLPAVPADPFTGGPLPYSSVTGEVSSAGKDPEGKPL